MKVTVIEPGNKIQLPTDWATELGLSQFASLEKTADGILVHPIPTPDWDAVFASKLVSDNSTQKPVMTDFNGDDLLF